MATTLDPILAAAQGNQSRRPLCKILSCENVEPIPFDGDFLSTSTINEQHPEAKVHSTGRLFVAFMVGPDNPYAHYHIRYGYTDAERTFFTYVDFESLGGYHTGGEVSVCELADSRVGIVWTETYGTTRYIKYRIITVTGADYDPVITGTIFSQSTTPYFTGPTVICLADDSYLLVYGTQDGDNHYHLYRRTSEDFITWSNPASEIPLSGLDDTRRKANPSMIELTGGGLWLLYDYLDSIGPSGEELTNVYYVSSTDKLATVSANTALTTYTSYAEKAEHPAATQTMATEIYFAFNRLMASLHMDKDTTGWRGSISSISNMHIDTAAQKLYVVSSRMGVGGKIFSSVAKIDLATWTIDKAWDTASSPPFSPYFSSGAGSMWWDSCRGDGVYVPIATNGGIISVLNAQTDTIKTYAFYDAGTYGIAKNVNWTSNWNWFGQTGMTLQKVWIDAANNKMYVALTASSVYAGSLLIGWILLTAPGPTYDFTPIVSDTSIGADVGGFAMAGFAGGSGFMEIVPSADLIIVGMPAGENVFHPQGALRIYSLSAGGLWKFYTTGLFPTFPWHGLKRGVYNNGFIVGGFEYKATDNQQDYRGLCIIDTATDAIAYRRPSWASVNDYELGDIILNADGEYVIAAGSYGVAIFDGVLWTLYSNTSVPGLTPNGTNSFNNPVAYNPVTEMIIAGSGIETGSWAGVIMFSRDGYIKQSNYRIGTYGTNWTWGDIAPLVIGFTDYEAFLCVDPDDGALYAVWTNKTGSELSIKWDKALPAFDLGPYLVKGQAVERSSTIDPHSGNWDAGLEFTISDGHLFDTSNQASLLRQYCSKGRKIQQQFGDKVSGVEYWEPVRVFTVSNNGKVVLKRNSYPMMKVQSETPRRRWEQIHIIASEYYQTTPEVIIADLIAIYDSPLKSVQLGTWDGSKPIDYQGVDVYLGPAIDQIAIRFGYCVRDGAEGIIEAVKISDAKTVDHTYLSNNNFINAMPNNEYSNFVNRWIVECEEKSFQELILAEEQCATFNTSHRWNTGSKNYIIDYTQGNKIYRNPRMEIVESVESLAFALAGGCSEELLDNSHNNPDFSKHDTYCTLRVESPDLTPNLMAGLAGLVASYFMPDGVLSGLGGGITIRAGSYLSAFELWTITMILAATGNCSYKIYGRPVVKVRHTITASVDDLSFQVKMGQVIAEQPFQDPLCESSADCLAVANYRKMVGMGERVRWSAEMISDLRNEEGDTISGLHPIGGDSVTVFLTDLKTTFLMPEGAGSEGTFQQEIEGWCR